MRTDEDREPLLGRARSGDRSAFDELCGKLRERLELFVKSRLGAGLRGRIDPEDILQETFLRAFESIGVFRGKDAQTFYNWLATISEHLIWNESQKRSLRDAPLVFEIGGGGVSPSRGIRRQERLERLEDALSALQPDQRTAILLAKIEGLRVKEIAERMGRSHGSVKQLLSRGLRELRRKFGDTDSLHLPDQRLGSAERDAVE